MSSLRINSIESFSTHDGPGVRCVIFLQGCPLRCIYCHNVETLDARGGEVIETDALVRKVMRVSDYFGKEGGVTVSGGEPLLQAASLIPLLTELKKKNINVALDTSGSIMNDDVRKVISLVDHVILDLKFATESDYKKYTNGSLRRVLEFLDVCESMKKRIWIRTVIVPGMNDEKAHIDEYLKILNNRRVEKIDLLPFHTLGFDKYKKLGMENPLEGVQPLKTEKAAELQQYVDARLLKY